MPFEVSGLINLLRAEDACFQSQTSKATARVVTIDQFVAFKLENNENHKTSHSKEKTVFD